MSHPGLHRFPHISGLSIREGLLYLEVPAGSMALYYFVPLRLSRVCGQSVPFAAQWPEHLKPFVYDYSPLPTLPQWVIETLPPELQADFASQSRDASGLRPWDQATFRGWPLYIHTRDRPGHAPERVTTDLFECVPVNLKPLPTLGEIPPCGP